MICFGSVSVSFSGHYQLEDKIKFEPQHVISNNVVF